MPSDRDAQQRRVADILSRMPGAESIRAFFPDAPLVEATDVGVLYHSGSILAAMEESYLGAPADTTPWERYRFLWLRTFHNPVAVRAEQSGAICRLSVRVLNGKSGYEVGALARRDERALEQGQWARLQGLLTDSQFWSLPLQGNTEGLDGAQWVLEGARPREHRVVARWSPRPDTDDAPFRIVCLYLLQLATLGVIAEPVY